ncbi:MAG: glutathione S-transferase N-terminal domain-containing protein [Gammaproteobacteria bacterium]|nr:glutathione S-transferase N-terminal domain-containing protein [Gammaproteobacteria bacterium]MCY4182630.1 glutathione S-transferase N-terminal domain-containing protein [Gammaproteobacteria bacterium]MCY4269904.1 glutathione S-transferase N-terminal domain-containing protein [Gammaproteobacteria bacterium]MCY4297200.1 glutathione S-transferase N-terminal domain-containing protein [Gammaproteobacteria bacterium]
MGVIAKRSSMTFYSDPVSHYSHRVRIVLAEKQVTVDLIDVDSDNVPEDLLDLNPYNSLPTLVDRELVLYESDIIMEYLDERFPHPPLFPVYPVARAQSRLWMYRVRREWCQLVDPLLANEGEEEELEAMRARLRDSLIATAPIFGEKPFFMSDEFTIVDCCVTPILWRLPVMGIELPKTRATRPLFEYRERLFNRDSIKASLSELEREMAD